MKTQYPRTSRTDAGVVLPAERSKYPATRLTTPRASTTMFRRPRSDPPRPEVAEVTMRAENTIELQGEDAERMQKLLDVLEDLDDVQDVYHNAEL